MQFSFKHMPKLSKHFTVVHFFIIVTAALLMDLGAWIVMVEDND